MYLSREATCTGQATFIVLLLVVIAVVSTPCRVAASAPAAVETKDIRVSAEEFPIFAWDQLGSDPARYKEAWDCGFNVGGFVTPDNLDMVQAAGLKCFVADKLITIRENLSLSNNEIATNVQMAVSRVASHPAVLGYHLIDEPDLKMIPVVARWVRAFNDIAPETIAFVNLFPYFEPRGQGTSYDDYLTSFVELAKPRVLSYDNYTLIDDGSIRPTFFLNFEKMRDISLKSGVPFWFIGLANAHFSYAEPTYATFRFQVYTALAYGVRGIGWFTFTSRDRGNYRLSAIDFDGRRTPTWEMLRAANMQIHRLAPVYLKLTSINVFHHPDTPKGCKGIDSSRYLNDLQGKGPFVVGEFEHPDGRPYFLVVNRNLAKSTSFNVVPKTQGKIMKVSSFTGLVGPWSAENNWLAPGQGMLLFLE